MPDIADILMARAKGIAEAMDNVDSRRLWRWDDYSASQGLIVAGYHDGGQYIDYRRPGDQPRPHCGWGRSGPSMTFRTKWSRRQYRPASPIRSGRSKGRFEMTRCRTYRRYPRTALIKDGLLPNDFDFLDFAYTAHFAETLSWEESKELGFREAVSTTFGVEVGGDVYGGKASASATAEFESTQNLGQTNSGDEDRSRETRNPSVIRVPPRYYPRSPRQAHHWPDEVRHHRLGRPGAQHHHRQALGRQVERAPRQRQTYLQATCSLAFLRGLPESYQGRRVPRHGSG